MSISLRRFTRNIDLAVTAICGLLIGAGLAAGIALLLYPWPN